MLGNPLHQKPELPLFSAATLASFKVGLHIPASTQRPTGQDSSAAANFSALGLL